MVITARQVGWLIFIPIDHNGHDEPNNSSMSRLVTAQRSAGDWRFFALLGCRNRRRSHHVLECGSPYRQAIAAPASLQVELDTSIWPLLAIALIQGGYWISRRTRPPLPQFTNALLGQFILFLARMGFVLPTSIFGVVFITQNPGFQIAAFRYGIILVGLFLSVLLRPGIGASGEGIP